MGQTWGGRESIRLPKHVEDSAAPKVNLGTLFEDTLRPRKLSLLFRIDLYNFIVKFKTAC